VIHHAAQLAEKGALEQPDIQPVIAAANSLGLDRRDGTPAKQRRDPSGPIIPVRIGKSDG
jgi:hypothetical protein